MSTSTSGLRAKTTDLIDPYALDPADIREPPKGWGPSLRFLGPGMITSAAVVGSGELLTATALGAKAGFMLLWLVFVSTFVKVGIQIELGRWSISTGKGAITGYSDVPPKIAGKGWPAWLSLLMFLQFIIGQAGVIGASGLAMSMLLPVGGDPFSRASIGTWVAVLVMIAIAIHISNQYTVVERISTVLVVLIAVFAVLTVLAVQVTPMAWTAVDIASGLQFKLTAGSMGLALAMFGMTGVGAGEITAYTYWCVEKGYAAWTGPNDGTDAWVRRARGWVGVMKKDAWVSWGIYTLSTAAFYILGAAVLNPQGLVPEGNHVMEVIASIFSSTLGAWGGVIFLIGAALALFKTIIANVPSLGRQLGNTLSVFGAFNWSNRRARDRWMKVIMIVLPISWGVLAVVVSSPLALVIIAGVLSSIYLMGVVVATLYLSWKETDARIKDGRPWMIYLIISALAVFAVGVISLIDQF